MADAKGITRGGTGAPSELSVTTLVSSSEPTEETGKAYIYAKTVGGVTDIYVKDSGGTETKISGS